MVMGGTASIGIAATTPGTRRGGYGGRGMVRNVSWLGRGDGRLLALSVFLLLLHNSVLFFLSSSSFFRPKEIEKHLSMLGFERIELTDNMLVGFYNIRRGQDLP